MGELGGGGADEPGPLSDADRAEITADVRRLYDALGTSWHGRVVWARSPREFEALADYGARRSLLTGSDRWRAWRRRSVGAAGTALALCSLVGLGAVYGSFAVLLYALMSLGDPSYDRVLDWAGLRDVVRPLDAPHGFVVAGWMFGIGVAGSLTVQSAQLVRARAPLDRVRPDIQPDPPPPRRRWRGSVGRDGGPRSFVVRLPAAALAAGAELTPRMSRQTAVLFGQGWSTTSLVFLPRRGTARRRERAAQASRALRRRVFACAPFRHLVVVLEPPVTVRTEEVRGSFGSKSERRLHSLDAPALEWADGEQHYFVHGRLTTREEARPPAPGPDDGAPQQTDDEEPPDAGGEAPGPRAS